MRRQRRGRQRKTGVDSVCSGGRGPKLFLRAAAADSRCNRNSAADEPLTKGFSAERPALICLMSARQFSSTVSASISFKQTLHRGSRRVLDRLSAFLSENIGSALKRGAAGAEIRNGLR
jgi:hypothetical protein